ncbi:AEC family transporter [Nitratireductor basaltis]|uniref:Auxin efflux carrier n=1 Tax=Nitratireductor basaltis TaxID=472175 RepID=A0A084UAN5_9HYPH|nr:AEC family transporter [Nitratireductor basaltis]KFB10021.1 Auxin efflux carrier [Nitratireductor basaltis]
MADIIGLVIPFFGLIFIGFIAARIAEQPLEALGWMNVFIVYVALPALFFQLVGKTPFEQLGNWRYILGVVLATYTIFTIMFAISWLSSGRNIAASTIKGLASAYGNIGYMAPGLVLLAFGPEAAVPVALIFSFENVIHFAVAPMMMAIAGSEKGRGLALAFQVTRKILLHPFIISTAAGVIAAYYSWEPPLAIERFLDYLAGAAAPCALFAMGVTLSLRPLKRFPRELALIVPLKLVVHPIICYLALGLIGSFPKIWVFSAVLTASLPTATNVFVLAQQYDVWVQRASASILVTTACSVFTVTALLYAIMNGYLPIDPFP